MTPKIVSGGQTGADRGGLDAAIENGSPHGGWCPKGRRAEDGKIPPKYDMKEHPDWNYLGRTEQNVIDSDATIVFTYGEPTGGSYRTLEFCRKHRKPHVHIDLSKVSDCEAVDLIPKVSVLNVAGSRESTHNGIQERVAGIISVWIGVCELFH